MNPTQEQIKEFWEWCGITFTQDGKAWQGNKLLYWHLHETLIRESILPLDLNNLFKYAVPKVWELGYYVVLENWQKQWHAIVIFHNKENHHAYHSEDPALALFWAIWGVIKEEYNESK